MLLLNFKQRILKMVNPVITGIASFGMSGQVFHGPCLRVNPCFRVSTIVERSKDLSGNLFPDARIVRDFDQLLADREIELVIVNTPDVFHFSMARQALLAGKHVVVEKPFTLRRQDAEELIALAQKQGKLLTVFQNRRWDSDFLTVRKVIESGLLGKLAEFESHFDRYRQTVAPSTWKEEGDEYAGVLYNLGSHMVDQALHLFGMPVAVTAQLQKVRPGSVVFDYYDLRLHYRDFNALLKCSYLVKEEGPRYILHGLNGSFLKQGIDPQEELLKRGVLPEGPQWGLEPLSSRGILNVQVNGIEIRGRVSSVPGNYPAFYTALYESVRMGKPLAVKPEESARVIGILEACLESYRKGATVEIVS